MNYQLYKQLADAGFPQGGQGHWIQHPDKDEKVYVPMPSELYAQLAVDPEAWQEVSDVLANIFIKHHGKN